MTGALDGPFIVLLVQERAGQAGDSFLIGENPDDFAPAFDLAVEALQRIGAAELSAMPGREAYVGQSIGLGGVEQRGELGDAWAQLA